MNILDVCSETRLRCSPRSEASQPRQSEILAAMKFVEADWPIE